MSITIGDTEIYNDDLDVIREVLVDSGLIDLMPHVMLYPAMGTDDDMSATFTAIIDAYDLDNSVEGLIQGIGLMTEALRDSEGASEDEPQEDINDGEIQKFRPNTGQVQQVDFDSDTLTVKYGYVPVSEKTKVTGNILRDIEGNLHMRDIDKATQIMLNMDPKKVDTIKAGVNGSHGDLVSGSATHTGNGMGSAGQYTSAQLESMGYTRAKDPESIPEGTAVQHNTAGYPYVKEGDTQPQQPTGDDVVVTQDTTSTEQTSEVTISSLLKQTNPLATIGVLKPRKIDDNAAGWTKKQDYSMVKKIIGNYGFDSPLDCVERVHEHPEVHEELMNDMIRHLDTLGVKVIHDPERTNEYLRRNAGPNTYRRIHESGEGFEEVQAVDVITTLMGYSMVRAQFGNTKNVIIGNHHNARVGGYTGRTIDYMYINTRRVSTIRSTGMALINDQRYNQAYKAIHEGLHEAHYMELGKLPPHNRNVGDGSTTRGKYGYHQDHSLWYMNYDRMEYVAEVGAISIMNPDFLTDDVYEEYKDYGGPSLDNLKYNKEIQEQ